MANGVSKEVDKGIAGRAWRAASFLFGGGSLGPEALIRVCLLRAEDAFDRFWRMVPHSERADGTSSRLKSTGCVKQEFVASESALGL